MRLALYQGPSPAGDIPAAFEAVGLTLAASSAAGVDVAVFPEVFLPGYNVDDIQGQALDGDWVMRLADLARSAGVALVIGLAERDGSDVYNTALAIGSDGAVLTRFRKIQLFGARERGIYKPGSDYVTFNLAGRTIGLLVCYDVEFPEHVRALVRKGADVILVPTANMKPFDNVNRYAVQARAMENAITVAYCNYCGVEGDLEYIGASVIAGHEGDPLAMAGPGPTLLITDIPATGDTLERPTDHLVDLRLIHE